MPLIAASKPINIEPPNESPEWTSTPNPIWNVDVGGTYDLSDDTFDQEGDTLTYTLNAGSTALPTGVTLSSAGILTAASPLSEGTTTGIIVDIDDGNNAKVASSSFSIILQPAVTTVVRAGGGEDYTTIQGAIDNASAGNVIEVRNDTPGSTQVWDEEMLFTSTKPNGTNGNEIILRFKSGDTFNFYPTTQDVYIIEMNGCSYWKIEGDDATVNIGDKSEWSFQNVATSPYTHERGIYAYGSANHIDISGLDFSGADHYQANKIDATCSYFRFRNCTADKHGSNDAGTADDWGNLFQLQSSDSIAEDCSFAHGGHDAFVTSGNGSVIRRCVFDGDWDDVGSTSPGARPCSISNGSDSFVGGQGDPWGPVLFEDNILKNCERSEVQTSGGERNQTIKLEAAHIIFRYNYMWDNRGQGPSSGALGSSAGDLYIEEVKYYNNTQYDSSAFYGVKDRGRSGQINELFREASIKNNIGTAVSGQGEPEAYFIWWDVTEIGLGSYPNEWMGAVYNNNQISTTETNIEVRGSEPDQDWVIDAETAWSNFTNNSDTTPVFVNSGARTKAGFALASGEEGVNDSESLTSITAGSSDSTTLTVDDAYHFYDGYNLSYFGEEGDWIIIYTDDTRAVEIGIRQIDSITDKNTIVLTTSITVSSGWVIYPMLNQTTTVLNRGAAQ